jgi:Zn ribbon nucleic-acid-binding protein
MNKQHAKQLRQELATVKAVATARCPKCGKPGQSLTMRVVNLVHDRRCPECWAEHDRQPPKPRQVQKVLLGQRRVVVP